MSIIRDIYKKVETKKRTDLDWESYLDYLKREPLLLLRDIFKLTSDLLNTYVGEGIDEYPGDSENINYLNYDTSKLFERTYQPFFSDRLFSNRFMNLFSNLSLSGQNKIYVVKGPPGCGKSTFLNNLFRSFEEFTTTDEGRIYTIVWKIDSSKILSHKDREIIEVPCPSNDNPLTLIPLDQRKEFIENFFDEETKDVLFNNKDYEWIFYREACSICSSIFQSILDKTGSSEEAFGMAYARRRIFDKRLGNGITVYNPSDEIPKSKIRSNDLIQEKLNELFPDCSIEYKYSDFAKTNDGIYCLMDIIENNQTRFNYLHGLASENIHKVDNIEEEANSIFLAISNSAVVDRGESFKDRIEEIDINYILDVNTQIKVYKNKFGENINDYFLPEVLENFSKLIITTRLSNRNVIKESWIKNPAKYQKYCDPELYLLKIEIYGGNIPQWLDEEDRKNFDMNTRRMVIDSAKHEGKDGLSERQSINIMWDFLNNYKKENELITMDKVLDFFKKQKRQDKLIGLTDRMINSVEKVYNYTILQQIKECLYYYNVEKITEDILDYLCSLNYDFDERVYCKSTGNTFVLDLEFLEEKEKYLIKSNNYREIQDFRNRNLKRYISETLREEGNICNSEQFKELYDRYIYNLKSRALQPFMNNETFREAIKDFGTPQFDSYDDNIKNSVKFLIDNLQNKFGYTMNGAKYVCVYMIDNNIAENFSDQDSRSPGSVANNDEDEFYNGGW